MITSVSLNTKDKDEYCAAEGIDHFAADLGIGVCELKVYDLGDIWLVMAHARSVNNNRPSCAAVTHDKKDRHSLEKAVRRAGRNAIKYMIPIVLLGDMFAKAKSEEEARKANFDAVKEASTEAGNVMRANRENFDGIATVAELLALAEKLRMKPQGEWEVSDWNYLRDSISDPNSMFLKLLQQLSEDNISLEESSEEPTEEESDEEVEEGEEQEEDSEEEEEVEGSEDEEGQNWNEVIENVTETEEE